MEIGTDILSLLSATLRISTPLVFAAMAGLFAERSGVIDFGLEGKMLAAAFVAAVGSYYFGSPWLGLILAMIACVSLSMLHGFASVTHKVTKLAHVWHRSFQLSQFLLAQVGPSWLQVEGPDGIQSDPEDANAGKQLLKNVFIIIVAEIHLLLMFWKKMQ